MIHYLVTHIKNLTHDKELLKRNKVMNTCLTKLNIILYYSYSHYGAEILVT